MLTMPIMSRRSARCAGAEPTHVVVAAHEQRVERRQRQVVVLGDLLLGQVSELAAAIGRCQPFLQLARSLDTRSSSSCTLLGCS